MNRSAFKDWTIPKLQEELVKLLISLGIDLQRMHLGIPMLHPLHTVGTYNWHRDRGVEVQNFQRGFTNTQAWLKSPIRPFFEKGEIEGRIRIEPGSRSDEFPFLKSAGEAGATDYFLQLTNFADRSTPPEGKDGIILSWISSAPEGFSEDALELLRKLRLPLCAQLRSLTHRSRANVVLEAYLGPYSSRRVYDGQVQRGDGEMIDAVIVFCDLRGSTKLAEHYDVQSYLALLNDYYEVTAGAFLEAGGEVLK